MTNEEIWEELQHIGKLMDQHWKERNLKKWNELVPLWRKLRQEYDFGYEVGDLVLCPAIRKNQVFTIAKLLPDNSFLLDCKTIVCGTMLKKYNPEPEQLTLDLG